MSPHYFKPPAFSSLTDCSVTNLFSHLKTALSNHFTIFLLPDHRQPPTNPATFSAHSLPPFHLFQSKIAEDSASDFAHSNTLPSLILPFTHLASLIIVDSLCGC